MTMTRSHLLVLAVAVASAASLPALAQHKHGDHPAPAAAATLPGAELVAGEVRKIDVAMKKITLKHGEIRSIGMPPMTMVYELKDVALAKDVKVGDAVQFRAVPATGGAYVVTDLRRAK